MVQFSELRNSYISKLKNESAKKPYYSAELLVKASLMNYDFGAADQKKADIEKACEWLFNKLGDTKLAFPDPCDEEPNRWADMFTEDFIDEFKKAMEE